MSSKRFAGEVIWGSCALGFNETCFGFCVFASPLSLSWLGEAKTAFMEHSAKRWQTREGTYQLKRRRLKPDVRDPPEDGSADVDIADI